MIDDTANTDAASPVSPKPEDLGRPVPGAGEALEPEAIHNTPDGAVEAGDKMWGPPAEPPKT